MSQHCQALFLGLMEKNLAQPSTGRGTEAGSDSNTHGPTGISAVNQNNLICCSLCLESCCSSLPWGLCCFAGCGRAGYQDAGSGIPALWDKGFVITDAAMVWQLCSPTSLHKDLCYELEMRLMKSWQKGQF